MEIAARKEGFSTTSTTRITCRRKQAKPAVAGQVHAEVTQLRYYFQSFAFRCLTTVND
jgi:hypothetical protein